MIDSYDVLWSSYDCHKLIYKVMIINKNSNHSQPLKTRLHYEWWVNWFEEVDKYKTLHCLLKYTRNKWRKNCSENL